MRAVTKRKSTVFLLILLIFQTIFEFSLGVSQIPSNSTIQDTKCNNFFCDFGTVDDNCVITKLKLETNVRSCTFEGTGSLQIVSGGFVCVSEFCRLTINFSKGITINGDSEISATFIKLISDSGKIGLFGSYVTGLGERIPRIDANGRGHEAASGPGRGENTWDAIFQTLVGEGASFGGAGGRGCETKTQTKEYSDEQLSDSSCPVLKSPADCTIGSGGGLQEFGGKGGGSIVFDSFSDVTLSNGASLSAQGADAKGKNGGGGSGGSISIRIRDPDGKLRISNFMTEVGKPRNFAFDVTGGDGDFKGGGGSGGRILFYLPNFDSIVFEGKSIVSNKYHGEINETFFSVVGIRGGLAGKFHDSACGGPGENGTTFFNICPRGTFSDPKNLGKCKSCDAGSFNSDDGQSQCFLCPPGTYQDRVGSLACRPCESGEFMEKSGATKCDLCGPGFFQPDLGQKDCDACPFGHFSTAFGAKNNSVCILCPEMHYAEAGSSKCEACMFYETANPGSEYCNFSATYAIVLSIVISGAIILTLLLFSCMVIMSVCVCFCKERWDHYRKMQRVKTIITRHKKIQQQQKKGFVARNSSKIEETTGKKKTPKSVRWVSQQPPESTPVIPDPNSDAYNTFGTPPNISGSVNSTLGNTPAMESFISPENTHASIVGDSNSISNSNLKSSNSNVKHYYDRFAQQHARTSSGDSFNIDDALDEIAETLFDQSNIQNNESIVGRINDMTPLLGGFGTTPSKRSYSQKQSRNEAENDDSDNNSEISYSEPQAFFESPILFASKKISKKKHSSSKNKKSNSNYGSINNNNLSNVVGNVSFASPNISNVLPSNSNLNDSSSSSNSNLNVQIEANLCSICGVRPLSTAVDCGHLFCSKCANETAVCPKCQQPISKRLQILL